MAVSVVPVVGAGTAQAGERLPCVDPPPCVHVSPDPEKVNTPGTLYVYRGYGWRPGARIGAVFGVYCHRGAPCPAIRKGTSFRADARGRFTFRFWKGRSLPPDIPRPAAAGGGVGGFRARRVWRTPMPTPPAATRAQSAEARTLAVLVQRTRRVLLTRRRAMREANAAYAREIGRCRRHWELFRREEGASQPTRAEEAKVLSALTDLLYDERRARAMGTDLRRFGVRLERLALRDPVLRAGADAWIAAVRRERPWPRPSLCAVMDAWRETGYDLARRPVDPSDPAVATLTTELEASAAIRDGARRLRALGGGARAESAFEGWMLSIGV